MSHIRRRPSLLGGLLWLGLGTLFLMRNFSIGPDIWSMAGRYWPILLILLGLGKVVDYYRQKEGISIRLGEVVGILILLLIGTAVTKISNSHFSRMISEIPIEIGGSSVQPGHWIGTSYSYNEENTYPITASTPLRVENSYGQVIISPGSDGEVRVRLRKVVFHNEEAKAKGIAGEIKLEAGLEGGGTPEAVPVKPEAEPSVKGKPESVFVVRTNRDSLSAKDYRFNTEMEVFIPKKSRLAVRNQYGEVRAVSLEGKLDLSTTHNPLEVHDCAGDVQLSNRYSESRILNHKGNATIDTRGRVYVETIKGDLVVRDEYAAVEIRDVEGKVTVSNTDSSVSVEKVTKPVVIEGQGCQVTATGLGDTLKLSTSHKRVQVENVASNVNMDTRYANVSVREVKGNLDFASNSDHISLDDIRGYLKIKADGSDVQANAVAGSVEIFTTRKDVTVNNFANSCKIVNEYGDVTLSTGSAIKGDLSVKNKNGDIELFLPESAAFQIDATARNGRVDSDFPGLEATVGSSAVGLLKGRTKNGAARIVLDTEYSNIHLRTRENDEEKDTGDDGGKKRRARREI